VREEAAMNGARDAERVTRAPSATIVGMRARELLMTTERAARLKNFRLRVKVFGKYCCRIFRNA